MVSGQLLETASDGGLKVCYLNKLRSGLDIRITLRVSPITVSLQ